MGWLFLYECDTKASVREHILRDLTRTTEHGDSKVLKHRTVGNHLWVAYEGIGAAEKKPMRAVILFLLGKSDGNWGYKDIDESMGPCEVDCPESIIKAVGPTEYKYAVEWRKKVAEHHAAKKAKRNLFKQVRVGVVVELKGCTPSLFRVANLAPFRGHCVKTGSLYRLKKSRLASVREQN